MRRAAAVAIGVDRTGGLDPLKSAAKGAERFAAWLRDDDFDVVCLTDGPTERVTSLDVSAAIAKYVTVPPTYDLLVVYFSGHGQWHTRADHWLLSGAPNSTAEAINLEGAMYLARRCGIPNVVFISDACRTIPRNDASNLVNGVDAFPNHALSTSKIDYFKATSEARPAYEVPMGGTAQSVLTHAILSTFEDPEPHIVAHVRDGARTIAVIPNRRLERVLQARVDAILDGIAGSPVQDVETNVPSADDVYIGRVRAQADPAADAAPPPASVRTSREPSQPTTNLEFGISGARLASRRAAQAMPGRAAADAIASTLSGLDDFSASLAGDGAGPDLAARMPDPSTDHFETETGFVVRGARVIDAVVAPRTDGHCDVLNDEGDRRGDAVRVHPGSAPALSVVVFLADGRCAVLAALRGFLGHARFTDEGLANVSYVPSSNSARWEAYGAQRARIDRLRALVALAVDRNAFRVRTAREAEQLARRIRVMKALDPTLGLYAAYAYAHAGFDADLTDVHEHMRADLGAELFDVAMLADGSPGRFMPATTRAPFCPMLTQGWNLLRARDVRLPEAVTSASRFLANSLWTTFAGRGTGIIREAVLSGGLP